MKQILLVNDVVGYSHVGMVAMLPILTHQGHAVFNLPTALVSNTLDYGRFNTLETTDYMRGTLPVWQELGFRFDAICTGLMFSEEQARIVSDYCRKQHGQGTIIFVDPIMGDAGRLYNGMGQKQVELMRDMVSVADLTMPNLTEACYLAGLPYPIKGTDDKGAQQLLDAVARLGAKSVVITSAMVNGQRCVLGLSDGLHFRIDYTELPKAFHGTGDIFSAVLIGKLMNGCSLQEGTQAAVTVVSRLIERNLDQQDTCLGIPVEQCMDLL
ncbi:MAG: bifunctional hydroxymethylpyrimidine kinase/phosphomethylpyrimidine kinase [Bacteroidales bacterium]|nr:bifunctional hydroxymethylpyrimidine kinase/phosphomethylpyrimidine kinase [Bacteroidales bacterium]